MGKILEPRDYQRQALDAIKENYENGLNRQLGVMATGMGKSSGIAANLPKEFPDLAECRNGEGGMLFIVHRIDIVRQTMHKFKAMYPDKWIAIEQGDNQATGMEDFIFASVDSLGRFDRIKKYKRRKFGLIVVDEAHHSVEGTRWDNILTYFGVGSNDDTHFTLSGGRDPLAVFLTATPERNDDKTIAPFLDYCPTGKEGTAFTYDILYGVRQGWLTDIRAYHASSNVDITDLDPEDQVDYMVQTWKKYADGKNTLTFAKNVAQSKLFVDTLNRYGVCNAAHVDAQTPKEQREEYLSRFGDDIRLLSNRLVWTEGFDAPDIQCILDAAPPSHDGLHIQKVGRGIRPHPSARIDDYDTAAERKEAIRNSCKPALTYITTFNPAEYNVSVIGSIWEDAPDMDTEGLLTVEEVVDVIGEELKETERDIRDIASISELEVRLKKVDVWSQTIENKELQTTTDLRWVMDGDSASIYLPNNPHSENKYENTPVIWRLEKDGEHYQFYEIIVGGWVDSLNHAVKARVKKGKRTYDLASTIRSLDEYLQSQDQACYNKVKRETGIDKPDDTTLNYLKRNQVRFGKNLTADSAMILKDNFRIQRKLDKIDFEGMK